MTSDAPVSAHAAVGQHHQSRGRTLTPAQIMERLQISETTAYHELQNGLLKDIAFRVGRQWRVSEAALERLMSVEAHNDHAG